ncbi:PepSY domain-containing protein [Eubacteriaceae bacterium ES2]|nr:PepSY domain-containing protein [Eubacteriaceae bacterium ES2]
MKINPLKSVKGKIISGLSLVMALGLVSAFALPAFAANSNPSTADNEITANPTEENDVNDSSEDALLASQVSVTEAQAIATVEAANPGTTVTCDELGNENGTAAYELSIINPDGSKTKALVDANTGAILSSSDTEDDNKNDAEENDSETIDPALAAQVKLTEAQAVAIAEDANPGSTVTCKELDNENGTISYEFTVTSIDGNKTELKVDANSGSIITDTTDEND